ncbi:hypothetical protein M9Y10_035266 [Tritrichomonas musculus]|uniref:Histone acetyltransferase n=1 Tax=Tritrichomonas musculus TaxID=1915356 RepID=A0ABR2KH79_9EUKA
MEKKSNCSKKNSNFQKGEIVSCYNKVLNGQFKGKILDFKSENSVIYAFITFIGQDSRLDDWYPIDELENVSNQSNFTENNKNKDSNKDSDDDDNVFIEESKSESQDEDEDEMTYSSELDLDPDPDLDPVDDEDDTNIEFEKVHREITKKKNIEKITIGKHTMRTWYYSPYPCPFHDCQHLYICENCFQYFMSKEDLNEHMRSTKEFQPYGREIYRNGNLSIFEMKGNCQKIPCQCLCLLGKLFLDHKTLYYDTEGFSFYVLCEMDKNGYHSIAYSSREVDSEAQNVLSCIVVFPPFQSKGYGQLLISLSYEIARRKKAPGGPEKPLSELGLKAFETFWKEKIVDALKRYKNISNIELIVDVTGISEDDIKKVLEENDFAKLVIGKSKIIVNKEKLKKAAIEIKKKKRKNAFAPRMLLWTPDNDSFAF